MKHCNGFVPSFLPNSLSFVQSLQQQQQQHIVSIKCSALTITLSVSSFPNRGHSGEGISLLRWCVLQRKMTIFFKVKRSILQLIHSQVGHGVEFEKFFFVQLILLLHKIVII